MESTPTTNCGKNSGALSKCGETSRTTHKRVNGKRVETISKRAEMGGRSLQTVMKQSKLQLIRNKWMSENEQEKNIKGCTESVS